MKKDKQIINNNTLFRWREKFSSRIMIINLKRKLINNNTINKISPIINKTIMLIIINATVKQLTIILMIIILGLIKIKILQIRRLIAINIKYIQMLSHSHNSKYQNKMS